MGSSNTQESGEYIGGNNNGPVSVTSLNLGSVGLDVGPVDAGASWNLEKSNASPVASTIVSGTNMLVVQKAPTSLQNTTMGNMDTVQNSTIYNLQQQLPAAMPGSNSSTW